MLERTLSIIKPDAVAKGVIGPIITMLEEGGLRVVGMRMTRLSRAEAEAFYAVHKERPFYGDLCTFMTSGPVVVMALEGEDAIAKNRKIMGATDSRKAEPGTIRAKFGTDVERNAVHGSDGPDTAKAEVAFFFRTSELA